MALAEFEQRLYPFAEEIAALGDRAQCHVVLSVVAAGVPGIQLSHSFLRLIATLGASLEVDLVV